MFLNSAENLVKWQPWITSKNRKVKVANKVIVINKNKLKAELIGVVPINFVGFKVVLEDHPSIKEVYFRIIKLPNNETMLKMGVRGSRSFIFRILNVNTHKRFYPKLDKALQNIQRHLQ